MAATSPLLKAYPTVPNPVSKKSYCVAGVLTTVYGLDELPNDIEGVNCLWLLHPRLQDQTCMEPIAYSTINAWNTHLAATKRDQGAGMQGLIAVSFDQRNHGSRKIDDLANLDWRSGNERHAQDMFSIYRTSPHLERLFDNRQRVVIGRPCRGYRCRHVPAPRLPPFLRLPPRQAHYHGEHSLRR